MERALNGQSEGLGSLPALVTVRVTAAARVSLRSPKVGWKITHEPEVTCKRKVWHKKKTSRNLYPIDNQGLCFVKIFLEFYLLKLKVQSKLDEKGAVISMRLS